MAYRTIAIEDQKAIALKVIAFNIPKAAVARQHLTTWNTVHRYVKAFHEGRYRNVTCSLDTKERAA